MNPLHWFKRLPLTVRVPMIVALLMIAISAAISERVLDRLAKTQEAFLEELVSSHLDAIAASILPSVLRQDSWEIFDTLERMRPVDTIVLPVETVVSTPQYVVLASDRPLERQTLSVLDSGFLEQFPARGFNLDGGVGFAVHSLDIAHQGQTVGRVFSIFDASPLLAERKQVLVTLLLTNFAVTLILGFVGFVMVRRMIRPMQVLETHMIEAASGKATQINSGEFPKADQEAVRMYRAFNSLVRTEQDRERLSKQLAEEEKLASLGRVASGMAHEINNPLGGLMNAVDTLRKHGDKAQIRSKSLDLIQRGLQGISDVVQAALATYRPERLARPVATRDFEDLRLLIGPELRRKDQTIAFDLEKMRDGRSGISAGPVRQAILNLLLNAIAATPRGGAISLKARQSQEGLIVEILDQGPGLPMEAMELLTGPELKGSPLGPKGLGLWVVRQIAEEIGATITVAGGNPCGTLIVFSVPAPVEERMEDAA